MEPSVTAEAKERKSRGTPLDRAFVALNKDLTVKIAQSLEEAHLHLKGVRVTRTEFVCWLLDKAIDKLGKEDYLDFKTKFQDEEGRLKWASLELKRRRDAGENPTLEEILKDESSRPAIEKRARRKKPDDKQTIELKNQGDQDGKAIENDSSSIEFTAGPILPPDKGKI